jgi:hypothetical protein
MEGYNLEKRVGGDILKKVILVKKLGIFALTVTLTTALLSVVYAKKPLVGTMDLTYNTLVPGPQPLIPDWVGTITIDGEEYGMLFFAIGSGKSFDDFLKGQVHFFEEIWAIYDTDFDLRSLIPSNSAVDWDYWLPANEPDELVLWGYDKGLTNVRNSKYHMNGDVQEANGIFSGWEGRSVHMKGVIQWNPETGGPQYAPGTFRIN